MVTSVLLFGDIFIFFIKKKTTPEHLDFEKAHSPTLDAKSINEVASLFCVSTASVPSMCREG